jgi:serine/threonine protein kinase
MQRGKNSDTIFVYFPFRVSGGHNVAVSSWEKQDLKPRVSGERPTLGSTVVTAENERKPLAVLIDAEDDLDRTKLVRRFWESQHAVFPIVPGQFLDHGAKILRSNYRQFDAVVVDVPFGSDEHDFISQIEQIASEFGETTFIIRRKKVSPGALAKAATPQEATTTRLPNLFLFKKKCTHSGIAELVQFADRHAHGIQEAAEKNNQLKRIFREHRTSPWVRGKKLGKGTFGDVYEACLSLIGGKMAVKTVRWPMNEPDRLQQLASEIEILSRVQHPNIVQYFYCESGSAVGEINIFMELCPGGSLQDKLDQCGGEPLPTADTRRVVQQVCSAVAYLHHQHIAHRDIKPANILFSENTVKIADFGTAATVDANRKRSETAGTFTYMAPEVFAGDDYGTQCDVWSIGCVLLDLLGRQKCKAIVGDVTKFGGYFSDCSNDETIGERLLMLDDPLLADFLKCCFRIDPQDRCTPEDLLLHRYLTSSPPAIDETHAPLQKGQVTHLRGVRDLAGALSLDSREFTTLGDGSDPMAFDDVQCTEKSIFVLKSHFACGNFAVSPEKCATFSLHQKIVSPCANQVAASPAAQLKMHATSSRKQVAHENIASPTNE